MFPVFNFWQGGSGIDYTGFYGDVIYRLLGFGGFFPDGSPTQGNRDVSDIPNIAVSFAGTNFGGIRDSGSISFSINSELNQIQRDTVGIGAILKSGDIKADNIEKIPYEFKFYAELYGPPKDTSSYSFDFNGALFPQITDRATLGINWNLDTFSVVKDDAAISIDWSASFFSNINEDAYNIEATIDGFTLARGATRIKSTIPEDTFNIDCALSSMTMEEVSSELV